jgi:hypothetical protein
VATGEELVVAVTTRRNNRVAGDVALRVRGSGAIAGEPETDRELRSDGSGRATLRLPVRARAGSYPLVLELADGATPRGRTTVDVVVTAGAVATVTVSPPRVELREGGGPYRVAVRVRDAGANGLPGQRVTVRSRSAEVPLEPLTATTDSSGDAVVMVPALPPFRGGTLAVSVGAREWAELVLVPAAAPAAPARLVFVAGAGQRGRAGAALPERLRVQVTDSAGHPMEGQWVRFGSEGARVVPDSAPTDSAGEASVLVVLGRRAGAVDVLGHLGTLNARATVTGVGGPPTEVALARGGSRVTRLESTARAAVTLVVTGEDAFGNRAALTSVRVVSGAERIARVGAVTIHGDSAIAVVELRGDGTTELTVEADRVRSQLPVVVRLPSAGRWALGARASYVGFDYAFEQRPEVGSYPGSSLELFLRANTSRRFSLDVAMTYGSLGADSVGGAKVSAPLLQGQLRGEYTFSPGAALTPVVSVATGLYRIRTDSVGALIAHTSLFAGVGVGVDLRVSRGVVAEARVQYQRLFELNEYYKGSVGSLLPISLGARFSL